MRIPQDIDKAIGYVARAEKIQNTLSLRKLARMGFESYVAKEYKDGKISLRQSADLLNLTLSETIDLLSNLGLRGNIHAEDVMKSLESLNTPN